METHLKKLIQIDGQSRELFYYPHRNVDGLVYRQEKILKKTIEVYKNRPDKLVYRSVTFDAGKDPDGKDIGFKDHHAKKDVIIKKMTLKYDLDTTRPPEKQHRKIVISYDNKKLYEYFHFSKNNVKESYKEHPLESMRTTDTNEKEVDRTGDEQKKEALTKIVKECLNEIAKQEASATQELDTGPKEEIFEKGIYDKARERVK